MGLFGHSLSQDNIDRLSYTWTVLLLLLFSLITLLLPLSPYVRYNTAVETDTGPHPSKSDSPRYQANCWTPPQFSSSHIQYVNAYCGEGLNAQLSGKNVSVVYGLLSSNNEFPVPPERIRKAFAHQPISGNNESGTKNKSATGMMKGIAADVQNVFSYRTPVLLFIMAVCVKLPHVLGLLLSSFFGSVNVDQTLKSLMNHGWTSSQGRRQMNSDLAQAMKTSSRQTQNSSSSIFLSMKILLCIVLLAETMIVRLEDMPRIGEFEKNLDEIPGNAHVEVEATDGDTTNPVENMGPNVGLCDVSIRILTNTQRFTLQCTFASVDAKNGQESRFGNQVNNGKSNDFDLRTCVLLYKTLYTVVLALLIVVLVMNVFNTVGWLCKLCSSCCTDGLTKSHSLSRDALLLLYMARENTGLVVANGLSAAFGDAGGNNDQGRDTEDEGMALK